MKYSENGFWVERLDNDLYRIGLSDKGQDDLGDVAFLEILATREISTQESMISVEASKATTELTAPLDAKVVEWHTALEKNPELLNSTNATENWIVLVEHVNSLEYDALMETSGL